VPRACRDQGRICSECEVYIEKKNHVMMQKCWSGEEKESESQS
jgi:hypothetical protein